MQAHSLATATKDIQSVLPDGQLIRTLIDGVTIRPLRTIEDSRGEVVDLYRTAWGVQPDSVEQVYMDAVRPGIVKAWVLHSRQLDRIVVISGVQRWVLVDVRETSPTYRLVNELTFSEKNRVLFTIPPGVYHAVQNVGSVDALFLNLASPPYRHEDPDTYRLPVQNDVIPFDFFGHTGRGSTGDGAAN